MNDLQVHINQDIKRDKTKIRTQQYIQLNTGAKEIKQFTAGGPDNRPNIKPKPSQVIFSVLTFIYLTVCGCFNQKGF